MHSARVIVCEITGEWARGLRRFLGDRGQQLQETRSLDECWEALQHSPISILVLELTAQNGELLLRRLNDLGERFPQARALVVGNRDGESREWLLREAGAVHAVWSRRRLTDAAILIERHLELAPRPQRPWREAVWQRLPWRSVQGAPPPALDGEKQRS